MSYDGIVTRCICQDLQVLVGGRVNKINQPSPYDLFLHIYANRKNYKLLISASTNTPRIHFSDQVTENPQNPPNFCMFLRKHLQGAKIEGIDQYRMDRVVGIDFSGYDDLGDPTTRRLVVEIMGKHSNIILIEKESGRILDSIKHVSLEMSRVRQILPGLTYFVLPDDKINILEDPFVFSEVMENAGGGTRTDKFFYQNFTGLSPLFAREVCYEAKVDDRKPLRALTREEKSALEGCFLEKVQIIQKGFFRPGLVQRDRKVLSFYCLPIHHLGGQVKSFESMSACIDLYYESNARDDRLAQKRQNLKKLLNARAHRDRNKLAALEKEFVETHERDRYRIMGDLLSTQIHRIQKGQKEVTLDNFYQPGSQVQVPLNPKKSPWENVEALYKKHTKLKTAESHLIREIPKIKEDLAYYDQVLETLEAITDYDEYREIEEELVKQGLKRPSSGKQKKIKNPKPSKPLHFKGDQGAEIYVGKNNRQNDELTLHFATKDDLFFHAKDIPGSHVILRSPSDHHSQTAIAQAALLAGLHSSGKNAGKVSVDYTQKKNVRKAKGAKPGMVYYENFTTLLIDLSNEDIPPVQEVK